MVEEIPLLPEVPPKLREAALRGTLIPFVGAGASRIAGCPNWTEFADKALRGFVEAGKFTYGQLDQIRHLAPRIKLSIARGLEAEHKIPIDYSQIISPTGTYENEAGRRLYGALASLAQTFVTTNYDRWLDQEPADSGPPSILAAPQLTAPSRPSKRKVYYDPRDFTPANLNQPQTVFHLHGSLLDPSSLVVTTRDYVTRYRNDRHLDDDPPGENRTLTFLDYLFTKKTVLFVGYGLDELEILEYVIQKGQVLPEGAEAEARHFMLQGFYAHEYELMRSLWGEEAIDSEAFRRLFKNDSEDDLRTASSFFWQIREDKLEPTQVEKILEFWKVCIDWASAKRSRPILLLSSLSHLATYFQTLDERNKQLLIAVASFVHSDYNTDNLIEELSRFVATNPRAVIEVLSRMLETTTPNFDLDDKLKNLIREIVKLGYGGDAIKFAEKLRRTLPGMVELYQELVSTGG